MPDLPTIEQDFKANVDPYIAEIQRAIDITNSLKDSVQDAIDKIIELQTVINDLEGKDVTVHVNVDMPSEILRPITTLAPEVGDIGGVTSAFDSLKKDVAEATAAMTSDLNDFAERISQVTEGTAAATEAQKGLAEEAKNSADSLKSEAEGAKAASEGLWLKYGAAFKAKGAQQALKDQTDLNIESLMAEAEAANRLSDSLNNQLTESFITLSHTMANLDNQLGDEAEARLINRMVDWDEANGTVAQSISRVEASLMNLHRIEQSDIPDVSSWTALSAHVMNSNQAFIRFRGTLDDVLAAFLNLGNAGGPLRGLLAVQPVMDFIARWHGLGFAIGEIAAVLIPVTIAFGAFASAAYPAMTSIIDRMSAVYDVVHATGEIVPPVTDKFNQLAASLRPDVYSIFGGLLNVINSRMGTLSTIAQGAGHVLEQLAARSVNAIVSSGFSSFLQNSVKDLALFGTFIGNIFGIIGNVLKFLPELAAKALEVLNQVTHALEVMTGVPAYQWVLHLGMEFHGLFMYATAVVGVIGLIVFAIIKLIGAISKAIEALNTLRIYLGVLALENPAVAIGIAAAAVVGFLFIISRLPSSIQQWQSAQDQLIASQNSLAGVMGITSRDIVTSWDNMKAAQTAYMLAQSQANKGYPAAQGQLQNAHALLGAVDASKKSYEQWASVHQHFIDEMRLEQFRVMELSGNKGIGGLTMAIGILSAAGVKVSDIAHANHDAWLLDLQAVKNLISGYQAMGQRGGLLGNDLNVLSIQVGISDTKVQALNQAWDAFLQLSTGLQSSFITLEQGIQTLGSSSLSSSVHVGTLTARVQNLSLKGDLSMSGLSQKSLALRSAFQQTLGNAEQLFNAIRVGAAAGAVSQGQLQTAFASVIAQLLPYAKHSRLVTSQLSTLAQEAGGPATDNFRTLRDWVDANAVSAHNLNGMIDKMTEKLTNVTQVAKNFATTMQQDVISALAQGAAPTQTLTQDSENLRNSLAKYPPQSQQVTSATQILDKQLLHLGFTVTEVKQLNQEMGAGAVLSSKQIAALRTQVQNTEQSLTDWPTHEHTFISMDGQGKFTITGTGATITPSGQVRGVGGHTMAAGGMVSGPGTSTSDSIPARLSHGEYIMNAASVAKYGKTFMDSVNAKHFAEGGLVQVDENMPNFAGFGNQIIQGFTNSMAKAMISRMTSAIRSAEASAAASAAGAHLSGTVTSWIVTAMRATGAPMSWLGALERLVSLESGGNPLAVNPTAVGGQHACVPLSTEILTRRGWLRHDQVQIGDETIGYNSATERSEWTRITHVHHYDDDEVWQIGHDKRSSWQAEVTPNHRWWSDTETVTAARKFAQCDVCGWLPKGKKNPSRGVQVHRAKMHGLRNDVVPAVRGEFIRTDEMSWHHRIRLAAPADTDGIPGLSVRDCAIVGWLMGDGHVKHVGKHLDCSIYQSKPQYIVQLRALLADVPHSEYIRQRSADKILLPTMRGEPGRRLRAKEFLPSHEFHFSRAFTTDLLKRARWGELSPEEFVLLLSPDQRAGWLSAMIDAEGDHTRREPHHKDFIRISQNDGPIQEAIKLAVYLEGYRPTYGTVNSEERGYKPCSRIGMANPHVVPSFFPEPRVMKRQPVWCVTTDLGTMTIRQKDSLPFLSGQSGLFQMLPSTFAAYMTGGNLFNPVQEGMAAIRYIMCVPQTTKILTRRGWLNYDEVQVGDETVGYNPETGLSQWTKIVAVHHYPQSPVIRMHSSRFDVRCTPNHRWLTEKTIQIDTRRGKARKRPVNSEPSQYKRFEFTEADKLGGRHRIRLAAYFSNDQKLPISNIEAEMHGRDLMARSGFEDNLESMVLAMSDEQREAFIRGLIGGDGYIPDNPRWSPVFAQNERRKLDSALLAFYLNGHYGNVTDSAGQKHVSLGKAFIKGGGDGGLRRESCGSEPVWCVTTELGSWTARQNAEIFLTGNSRYGSPMAIPGLLSGHYGGYDQGGWLMPGMTMAFNNTGVPERVVPPGGDNGMVHVHSHVYLDGKQIWSAVQQENLRYQTRNSGRSSGNAQGGGLSPVQGQTIVKRAFP